MLLAIADAAGWWYTPTENMLIGSWEMSQRSPNTATDVDVILTYNKDHSVTMSFVHGKDQVREVSYPIEWTLSGRSLKLTAKFADADLPVTEPVEATTHVLVTRLNSSTMVWYGHWYHHGAVLKRVDPMLALRGTHNPGPLVGVAGVNQGMVASSR
jgi:hypothetical protein